MLLAGGLADLLTVLNPKGDMVANRSWVLIGISCIAGSGGYSASSVALNLWKGVNAGLGMVGFPCGVVSTACSHGVVLLFVAEVMVPFWNSI
jgi:hypothetical protein